MTGSNLLRHGLGYGSVGILQLLADWFCFVVASAAGIDVLFSNIIGRAVGAILGFWLNGAITFRDENGGRLGWRRLSRYIFSWSMMLVLSTLAVNWVKNFSGLKAAWLVKPVIDAGLALIGFLISRYWIYK